MKKYTYKIYHEYQIGDQSVLFNSTLEPETMKDILAFLEFFYEEYIDDSESVCGRAATKAIHKCFSPIEYIDFAANPIVINTYYNREERCGISDDLIREFDRAGLLLTLKNENKKETKRLLREIPELQVK